MKSILKAGFCAATFVAMTQTAAADPKPNHVVVLYDASASNPLVRNKVFAARVAGDVLASLPDLRPRDRMTVGTLGSYAPGRNPTIEAVIDKRFGPEAARNSLSTMTRDFPDAVARQLGGVQDETNIVGALQQMARRLDCRTEDGQVIVLTDGLETGGQIALPQGRYYEGCTSFSMIGVMAATPQQTQSLGDAWMRWCDAAGFARCDWRS